MESIANSIIALWNEGMYIPEIVQKVGIDRETVELIIDNELRYRQTRKEVFSPGFAEV